MFDQDFKKFFEILEVGPDASFSEVRSSYLHLKGFYSSKSSAIIVLMDQLAEGKRLEILTQLKEAYNELKTYFAIESKVNLSGKIDSAAKKRIPEFETFSGKALRLIREVMGIEVEDAALATGIPHKHLKSIEQEEYDFLPPPGYVKAFLKKYAEYLALDSAKVTRDYMKRYMNREKIRDKDSF